MRMLLSVSCLFLSALVAEAAEWAIHLSDPDGKTTKAPVIVRVKWASGFNESRTEAGKVTLKFDIPDRAKVVALECIREDGSGRVLLNGLNGALDQTLEIVVPGRKAP